MKCAIVVFLESNCDIDTYRACEAVGWEPNYVLHDETEINGYEVILLTGGFSCGENSSSVKLAKFSPIMQAVSEYIKEKKGFVIGIGNGFQILCECSLLPGVLTNNENNKFICRDLELVFTEYGVDRTIVLPIAHDEGKYFVNPRTLKELEDKNMIFLRYKRNPNGSVDNIAGIYDRENMVLGMMPHPERAVFKELGLTDGKRIFDLIKSELSDVRA